MDSGILDGGKVTTDFDPMLSKLIVHGRNRAEAIARGRRAAQVADQDSPTADQINCYFPRANQVSAPRLSSATRATRASEPTEPPLATNAM